MLADQCATTTSFSGTGTSRPSLHCRYSTFLPATGSDVSHTSISDHRIPRVARLHAAGCDLVEIDDLDALGPQRRGIGVMLALHRHKIRPNIAAPVPTALLVAKGEVRQGDLIVLTIGEPMGKSGGTNTMKIVRVGEHRA